MGFKLIKLERTPWSQGYVMWGWIAFNNSICLPGRRACGLDSLGILSTVRILHRCNICNRHWTRKKGTGKWAFRVSSDLDIAFKMLFIWKYHWIFPTWHSHNKTKYFYPYLTENNNSSRKLLNPWDSHCAKLFACYLPSSLKECAVKQVLHFMDKDKEAWQF